MDELIIEISISSRQACLIMFNIACNYTNLTNFSYVFKINTEITSGTDK